MKTFAAALAILAVILGCAIANCIYIDRTCSEMLDLEKKFPEKENEDVLVMTKSIKESKELWDRASVRLYTTVKATYINNITASLQSVIDYYENGSSSDYIAARSLLREALIALKEADSLSFRSII